MTDLPLWKLGADAMQRYEKAEQKVAFACLVLEEVIDDGYPNLVAKYLTDLNEKMPRKDAA